MKSIGIKRIFSLVFVSTLITSCSSTSDSKQKPIQVISKDSAGENHSDFKKVTIEAKDSVRHYGENHFIGSARISKSGSYKGKTYFLYGAEHLNLDNYYFDIPVVYNKAVKKWINYFLNRGRGFFERYSARAGRYAPIMGKILEDHGLPRDLIFLAMAESGFQTKAKSWAKAVGPWQFMPYTGRRYGLKYDWYVDERRDPVKASIAASKYLKKLYNDFGAWELAAAAYNAGEGKMSRAIRRYKTENFWHLRKGRYLKAETKNYVPKIMALAIIGKNMKAFGFEDIDFHDPLDFEEVQVAPNTDLIELANKMNMDFEEIQILNPEILRWFTPPNVKSYTLRLPVGMKTTFNDCCSKENFQAVAYQTYKVRGKRSTLKDVARKFKIKKNYVLTSLNDARINQRLGKGYEVVLPFRLGQSKKENMYSDLYERPRRSVLRRRAYKRRLRLAKRRGHKIVNPKQYYVVQRGDSLWSVSKKTGTKLNTIIASNLNILNRRQIRAGDKLVVK